MGDLMPQGDLPSASPSYRADDLSRVLYRLSEEGHDVSCLSVAHRWPGDGSGAVVDASFVTAADGALGVTRLFPAPPWRYLATDGLAALDEWFGPERPGEPPARWRKEAHRAWSRALGTFGKKQWGDLDAWRASREEELEANAEAWQDASQALSRIARGTWAMGCLAGSGGASPPVEWMGPDTSPGSRLRTLIDATLGQPVAALHVRSWAPAELAAEWTPLCRLLWTGILDTETPNSLSGRQHAAALSVYGLPEPFERSQWRATWLHREEMRDAAEAGRRAWMDVECARRLASCAASDGPIPDAATFSGWAPSADRGGRPADRTRRRRIVRGVVDSLTLVQDGRREVRLNAERPPALRGTEKLGDLWLHVADELLSVYGDEVSTEAVQKAVGRMREKGRWADSLPPVRRRIADWAEAAAGPLGAELDRLDRTELDTG